MLRENLLLRLSGYAPRKRWAIAAALLVIYFPFFILLHSLIGSLALASSFVASLLLAVLLGPSAASAGSFLLLIPSYFVLRQLGLLDLGHETPELVVTHMVMALVAYVVGVSLSMRRDLAHELAEHEKSEARFRGLFERNNDAVLISDPNMIIIDVNHAAARLLGYTSKELIGKPYRDLIVPEQHADLDQRISQKQTGEKTPFFERTYIRKDGSLLTAEVNAALIQGSDGTPLHFQTISRDITERKAAQDHLYYKATHDSLTSLFNRSMLAELLARAIEHARRHNDQMAVLFIDLDNFKSVNDTHGHIFGDRLLKECSARLKGLLRKSDVIARVGGDEFAVLLEPIMKKAFAEKVADNIVKVLSAPFMLDGKQIEVSASVGISMFPADAQDADALLGQADQLMYGAKHEKKRPRPK